MSNNNFLSLFNMNMLMRFIISSVLTIVFITVGNVYNFSESLTSIQLWWVTMLAAGIVIILTTLKTAWHWPGLILASFLMGVSSQLSLIHPLWFQYIKIAPEGNFSYVLYATIFLQVIIALKQHISFDFIAPIRRLIDSLGIIRTLSFFFLLLCISTPAIQYIGSNNYFGLLKQTIFTGAFLLINMASLFAIYRCIPEKTLIKLTHQIESSINLSNIQSQLRIYDKYFPGVVGLWVLVISTLVCIFAFERVAHVEDEIAYLFQAKYLLLGQLTVKPPIVPEAFDYYLLTIKNNMWFSVCLPGWPAILAIGVLFKSAWLVNPILASINIFLAHSFFKRISSPGFANIAILLIAFSPWYILMSASLMPHILTLTLVLAAWLSLLNAQKQNNVLSAFIGGIFMGFLFLTRPFDGLIVGLLTFLWTLTFLKQKTSFKIIIGYCLGCIAMGALIFPYNDFLTGSPWVTPLNEYADKLWHPGANNLGFGLDIGPKDLWNGLDIYQGHSFWEAIINSQQSTYMLNFDLFGWGIGSLSLFLVHILWGKWTRHELYLLVIIITTICSYGLYWFSGSFYIGPRYWFISFIPLIYISTSGIYTVVQKLGTVQHDKLPIQKFSFIFLCLSIVCITTSLSWRGISRYYEFRGFHTDYQKIISENNLENSLIFVKTSSESDFASAFMNTSPTLSGSNPIFALDLGSEKNRSIASAYPDRSIYFISGRTKKQPHAQIVLGPVSRSALP